METQQPRHAHGNITPTQYQILPKITKKKKKKKKGFKMLEKKGKREEK
jgi:hypothetical protein